ncbi:TrkA family potassium uptake protein [Thiohalocapsa marina]|uniref:TrkA family potassium uptake protein n=1 Tax=Thiohalocapsa marina TaxID=424902 RepID=A0A5M8FGD6_9GAMM|nr:TrkA family potassium uptake protein [Thiohalocapsa marina]KAA6183484.1 TrkA family potassium uptake protein [Thiohalocapsa marina]
MRFVFIGSGTLAVLTSRMLVERQHEVVIIERSETLIEQLREEVDAGFIHGDGTRPAILREADPEATDLLFCLTRDDQSNIIASLVARSLGYRRVVTKIEDPELEHICAELGLAGSLIPMHTVGRYLADMAEGQDIIELSDILRGDTRIFSFRANAAEALRIDALSLPESARVICVYGKDDELRFADPDLRIQEGDVVVVLTRTRSLKVLRERFGPQASDSQHGGGV